MSFLNKIFLIFTIQLYQTGVLGQQVPPSPCPDIFKYQQQASHGMNGIITIPYQGSTTLNLGVNASIKGYYTDKNTVNLKIKMITPGQDLIQQRARFLTYTVDFPFQHTIPKITNIELNGRSYCTGPPEELIPGSPGVTSLWAGHKFYFQAAPSQPESEDSYQDIGQPVNSNTRYPTIISQQPPSSEQRFDNSLEPPGSSRNEYQECGVSKISIVPLILGGTEISDGMFPWLSALFVSRGVGYEYKCTGNLISERHVITAARCIFYYKVQIVQTEDLLFIFGKSNLRHWATSGAVTRGVTKILPHPEFNQESGHADILIATLDRQLKFSSTISPICLWSGESDLADIVDKRGTVAGWGTDKSLRKKQGASNAGQYNVLLANSLDMPVVSNDDCLNSNLSYYSLTSDKTFCAGQRDGTGTCIGDVGAGFMINDKGKFSLRGLASIPLLNNKGECDISFFMVFCDVAKFTDWIKTTIK